MRLLVDTHAFFWWLTGSRRLSASALTALEQESNEVLVSAVVAWELATKVRVGKWPGGEVAVNDLEQVVSERLLTPIPITIAHARLAGSLPGVHRDPFDRVLAAQAIVEGVPLVTADPAFRGFDVKTLW